MGKQLRALLEKNSYRKKVITADNVTLGKIPKRAEIQKALGGKPKSDLEVELRDKKGNIFIVSYSIKEDEYHYITKTLVT